MNLDIWPPPPPISTWLARFDSGTKAWLVDACGRKWRWMLWLSAWLWSMDISNVCPKAMPDFRPSVLLADIQIPICGKGFSMPVKCCLNYYHEIFRDHIFFCVWNCMTVSDNRFVLCLFVLSYKSIFWTWAGCVARGIIILKHPVHAQQGSRIILNAIYDKCMGVQNLFFFPPVYLQNFEMQSLSNTLFYQ